MPKPSIYTHIQPWREGYSIAYNARTGALALLTDDNRAVYRRVVEKLEAGQGDSLDTEERELLGQLKYGGFAVEDTFDEFSEVKFNHNCARYDRSVLGLTLAPTLACNMACTYCYESSRAIKMKPDIIEAIIRLVEKKAPSTEVLQVGWYGGEPLLAMDVIEDLTEAFVDIAQENNTKYVASIITNGYLLTPPTVDRLKELQVRTAQVTLDGPARIHNKNRPLKNGQESFDTIVENIQYASKQMAVSVRVNVDKSYTKEIILELLAELERADLQNKIVVYFGQIEPYTQACANISESCYEVADFSRVEVEFYRLLLDRGFRVDKLPRPLATYCVAQTVGGHVVDPEGYLYRCWNHVGNKEKAMGKIDSDLDYQHPNFRELFAFSPFENADCVECNLLPICMGGCPGRRVERNLSGDQLCEAWKHNLQPMLELIAQSRQQMAAETAAAKE